MSDKKFIVIADDEPECRQEFTSRPDHFEVFEVANACNLVDELKKLSAKGLKPDLVLLDIWRPPERVPEDQAEREKRARKGLQDLTVQLEKTRKAVQEAWIPRGFHVLEELRREWPNADDLPVAMYSKRGYFLATPDQLELIENKSAHWILKNDEHEYFEYVQDRIDRLVREHSENRLLKKRLRTVRVVAVAAIFASFSILALLFGRHILGANSLAETGVSGIFGILIAYGLDRLLLRDTKQEA